MDRQTYMEERYSGASGCHGEVSYRSEEPCPAGIPLAHESEVNNPVCEFLPYFFKIFIHLAMPGLSCSMWDPVP